MPYVGLYIFVIAIIDVFARLSLMFPVIAIGKEISFRASWDATNDYKLMMFTVVALIPMAIGIFEYTLSLIPGLGWLVYFLSFLL